MMLIEPLRAPAAAIKEIKVKLPPPLVLRLHAVKLLHGQSMHRTVERALEAYFATQPHK